MPPRKDALIALAVLALAMVAVVGDRHPWPVALLALLGSAPLAWRRTHTLPAVSAVSGSSLLAGVAYEDASMISVPIALLVCAYTAGRELDPPAAWLGGVLVIGSIWIGLAYTRAEPAEFGFSAALLGGVWGLGHALRRRDADVRAARERERAAVHDERTRIARELHDVVSHSLSVIAIQTQAVRRRLRDDQDTEAADLQAVERVTREALAEMRRLFGVLRAEGETGALAPQPGLGQLDALVAQTGMPVQVTVLGDRRALPPGLDLAAYRIIQEGLTNARRHSGASGVEVVVDCGDRELAITIQDDGRGPNGGEPGHGLLGMRERVALYGGRLETGARPGGGFRLAARLPRER